MKLLASCLKCDSILEVNNVEHLKCSIYCSQCHFAFNVSGLFAHKLASVTTEDERNRLINYLIALQTDKTMENEEVSLYQLYPQEIRAAIAAADKANLLTYSIDAGGFYVAASNLTNFLKFLQEKELLIITS